MAMLKYTVDGFKEDNKYYLSLGYIERLFQVATLVVVKDGKIIKESAYGYLKKYDTTYVNGEYKAANLLPKSQWEPATVNYDHYYTYQLKAFPSSKSS